MEKTRVTKKEYFERLIGIVEGANVENAAEIVDFLNHEIELVSKKRSSQTKIQKENEVIVEFLYEVLAKQENAVTVSELMTVEEVANYETENGANLSNQKISALLKKLVEAGRVVKSTDKKKSYFSVITD